TIVLSGIGVAAATLTIRDTVPCVPAQVGAECTDADPASPAAQAGLQPGDTFAAVDGTAVTTWGDLTSYVAERPGTPVELTVVRDGQERTLTLTPGSTERTVVADADGNRVDPYVETVGFMGVSAELELRRQPLSTGTQVTGEYLGVMTQVVATLPVHLYEVSRAALGLEERDPNGVVGLVGIGRIAAESSGAEIEGFGWTEKFAEMLLLLGGLNLALFVFNMVPLVPLDGGHIASALWQAVKNGWARARGAAKPFAVDVARQMPLAYGVFGILILMAIVLVYADIAAPVTRG
ncbi:MAG: PDZ domain-containing protein, partial [Demequina sp.]